MNLKDIFNSINTTLEKTSQNNSFINTFIDELKSYLNQSNSLKNSKSLNTTSDALFTLDRYEGEYAICEDRNTGKIFNVSKDQLPQNAKEGDILIFKDNTYQIDYKSTQTISKHINNLFDNLTKDN